MDNVYKYYEDCLNNLKKNINEYVFKNNLDKNDIYFYHNGLENAINIKDEKYHDDVIKLLKKCDFNKYYFYDVEKRCLVIGSPIRMKCDNFGNFYLID